MTSAASKIWLTSRDGHRYAAWFGAPSGTPKGGILILHSIFGMTSHLADVCTRWAAEGYAAIAPALFDRTEGPNVFAYDRPGADAGVAAYDALTQDQVFADIQSAQDHLRPFGRVAISGFCTGGSWAWRAAAAMPFDAQVNFYGSHISQFMGLQQRCPTLLHYGDHDHIMPLDAVEEIQRQHPDVDVRIYRDVGHAFFNPDQATYHADAAATAWTSSLEFMQRHIAPA